MKLERVKGQPNIAYQSFAKPALISIDLNSDKGPPSRRLKSEY
jgi:hypothetical protein